MMMHVSSREISEQISELDAISANHESEAKRLSFDAVSGDMKAAKRLSDINREINRMSEDRVILERAREIAIKKEAETAAIADAESRAAHMAAARKESIKLLDIAAKTDALISDLLATLLEMDAAEGAIWAELRQARVRPPGVIVGRNGLSGHAADIVKRVAHGVKFTPDPRGCADLARVGWSFLIDEHD
jgi:hypothetical protein